MICDVNFDGIAKTMNFSFHSHIEINNFWFERYISFILTLISLFARKTTIIVTVKSKETGHANVCMTRISIKISTAIKSKPNEMCENYSVFSRTFKVTSPRTFKVYVYRL